ncbi:GDP dissociation inhibitor-domain-containing protein [Poronia punctata]|nr:GDP dissociation inhibitor-domain-containing protein [Poronia punctata]
MESLDEATWDAVLYGTGLSQSLLALALSRSNKRVLHLDPNDFYGENEAALSLQEADAWASAHAGTTEFTSTTSSSVDADPVGSSTKASGLNGTQANATSGIAASPFYQNANTWKHPDAEAEGLSFPRAYSLALAPQIIYTKSKLLSQLVSSRAYRQVEFLAVGSFFVYGTGDAAAGTMVRRIPSSREDVFSAQSIPARSKRALMKFLKFVVDYDSEEQKPLWQGSAKELLSDYLVREFKLDVGLRDCILALTLTLDGKITLEDGLASIHRHLTSTGFFGPGFCAVYPKWGGLSEVAQVGCRAGAVGGGIYMLSTEASVVENTKNNEISLGLSNGMSVRTTAFVSSQKSISTTSQTVARLVAVVNSPLTSLFEKSIEGAPVPAVAVVAFPPSSLSSSSEPGLDVPIYAFVHSSDTGECPSGQSVVYLTMLAVPRASHILDSTLSTLIQASAPSTRVLYKLYYEQSASDSQAIVTPRDGATVFEFPSPSLGLSFDDASLNPVKEAWKLVMKGDASDDAYMMFEDREGMVDDESFD